jgi:hypothetical protein
VLHSSEMTKGPHVAVGPSSRWRVFMRVPPPHVAEHAPKLVHGVNLHVAPVHAPVVLVHGDDSMSEIVVHAATLFSMPGGSVRRTRVRVPGPQLESHMDQSLHSETGHGSATEGVGHSATGLPHDLCMNAHDGWRRKFGPHTHSSSDTKRYVGSFRRTMSTTAGTVLMDCANAYPRHVHSHTDTVFADCTCAQPRRAMR